MNAAVLAVLWTSQAAAASEWHAMPLGDRCVGTSETTIVDAGRIAPTYQADTRPQPRILSVRLWYPVDSCTGEQLLFWHYWGDDEDTAQKEFIERVRSLGGNETVAIAAARHTLRTHMVARAGSPKRSPGQSLILIPGNASDHAPLAESLASHGHLVATIARQGTQVPGYIAGISDLESQVQDLQRVIANVSERTLANASRTALVCHAINSTACAMLAMRDPRIAALVSWEGGLPSRFEQDLLRRSSFYEVAALRASMLVVHAPHPNIDPEFLDPYVFASQLRVQLPHTTEYHLLTFGLLEDIAPGILGSKNVHRTGDALRLAADILLRFLRAELLGDTEERRALATRPSDAGEIIGEWTYRPGNDARVAVAELQRLLHAKGVAGLRDYCRAIDCARLVDPETFRRLAAWVAYGDPPLKSQALEFAKLRVETFPRSARARAQLAIVAQEQGDQETFDRESEMALELLEIDTDPTLDTAARARVRAQIQRAQQPAGG